MLLANEAKAARERLTLIRIHEELRALGYAGSYDAVRRYARQWRQGRVSSSVDAYVPLNFAPGEAYQFGWSHEIGVLNGATTTVKVAHVRLCHSRMFFVRACPRETQEMVFDAHDRAFAFSRGTCTRGIYDNMRTAVDTVLLGKERAFNRRFAQMCAHYLVEPVACPRRGHPWHGGRHHRRRHRHPVWAAPAARHLGLHRRRDRDPRLARRRHGVREGAMSYSSKIYRAQGGDRLVVEAGGSVQVKNGGQVVGDAGTQADTIADVTGGATVDAEARTAINAVLAALRAIGIVAG